jgi:tetratricopeptide (TPR) repeat protein
MTKRIRNRPNNKKIRKHGGGSNKPKKSPPTKSVDEWLHAAATCMTTLDIEVAYQAYQQAHNSLLTQKQQPEQQSTSSSSSSSLEQMLHVLEKMGEIQVSLNDPDQARQHFWQALQLVEAQAEALPSSWNMLETHANFCLYLGQLSMEQEALEAYVKGISSLEKCLQLFETEDEFNNLPSTAADTDMATEDERNSSQPSRHETLQLLKQKLSGAYCNVADLYLTDLCDEETAESDCQQYLEKALHLKGHDGEPMVDALQTMANLRLSQEESRRHEAVDFILRAYEKQRVGSEALAALVGLQEGGKQRQGAASMQEEEEEEEQAKELLEVDAANNLPEFEFRCQTAKILLECADLLSKKRENGKSPSVISAQETQCVDAAISVLGSLLAQNDEVVEIWYLTGCAFAAKTPPLADAALFYLERAQTMLTDIRKGLTQESQFAEDDVERSELEQELELNEEQMKDVLAKADQMRSSTVDEEDIAMLED